MDIVLTTSTGGCVESPTFTNQQQQQPQPQIVPTTSSIQGRSNGNRIIDVDNNAVGDQETINLQIFNSTGIQFMLTFLKEKETFASFLSD